MWQYNQTQLANDELQHYGVIGMKWGVHRSNSLHSKARNARESSKEWKEIGAYKSGKLRSKGKNEKADKVEARYNKRASKDLDDAKKIDAKAHKRDRKNDYISSVKDVYKQRSMGSKILTNVLAGPFANRTYNSVIASGGSSAQAAGVTAVATLLGGPIGHLAVSQAYVSDYGSGYGRIRR